MWPTSLFFYFIILLLIFYLYGYTTILRDTYKLASTFDGRHYFKLSRDKNSVCGVVLLVCGPSVCSTQLSKPEIEQKKRHIGNYYIRRGWF